MTLIGNTIPAKINIQAVRGDTIDLTLHVSYADNDSGKVFYAQANSAPALGLAYNPTSLTIHVRRKDNLLIKEWISGVSPSDIVISGSSFRIYDLTGFEESGAFDYEVEDTNSLGSFTIIRGEFWVQKQITT